MSNQITQYIFKRQCFGYGVSEYVYAKICSRKKNIRRELLFSLMMSLYASLSAGSLDVLICVYFTSTGKHSKKFWSRLGFVYSQVISSQEAAHAYLTPSAAIFISCIMGNQFHNLSVDFYHSNFTAYQTKFAARHQALLLLLPHSVTKKMRSLCLSLLPPCMRTNVNEWYDAYSSWKIIIMKFLIPKCIPI